MHKVVGRTNSLLWVSNNQRFTLLSFHIGRGATCAKSTRFLFTINVNFCDKCTIQPKHPKEFGRTPYSKPKHMDFIYDFPL